ncbi:MAG TPA: hypothetical protein VND94_16970 [Terriglobia bacterium]|nr:hypothetical protein [Terriglobia bacterium]
MSMTQLETAILNMLELAAVEDKPPFARLLGKRRPTGSAPAGTLIRQPSPQRSAKTLDEG